MSRIEYKGYIIHATTYQLAEDKSWTINIHIKRHTGSGVNDKNFSAANTFPTKTEAIKHCFRFGKQIIDGKVKDCTVDDLLRSGKANYQPSASSATLGSKT